MGFKAYVVGPSLVAAAIVSCTQFAAEDAQPPPGVEGGAEDSTATLTDASGADGNETKDCGAVLATDRRNCGRCGHDCLGGDCAAGQCQPFAIFTGLLTPGELALGESRIYWETNQQIGASKSVMSCARDGCLGAPATVISGLNDVQSLLVAGDTLFFATFESSGGTSAVEVCTLSACPMTRRGLDSRAGGNLRYPFTPMRERAGAVYWGKEVSPNGEIRRFTLDAGIEPTTIAYSECDPARVTVGAMDVTWSCRYSFTLRRCAIPCTVDGGGVFVDAGGKPVNFERGATQLVWDTDDGLKLQIVAQAGGIPSDLPARGVGPIAVVGDSLIFQDGLVARIDVCELPSCASRTTLAKATATSLVADERAVFWTVPATGVVMSVAR